MQKDCKNVLIIFLLNSNISSVVVRDVIFVYLRRLFDADLCGLEVSQMIQLINGKLLIQSVSSSKQHNLKIYITNTLKF